MESLEAGNEIDAYCDECEQMHVHVIVTTTDSNPERVECMTCNAAHEYSKDRAIPEKKAKKKTKKAKKRSGRARVDREQAPLESLGYKKLMQGRDLSGAIRYEIGARFNSKDVIDHRVFGVGLVTRVLSDEKIEVVFAKATKVLVHDR